MPTEILKKEGVQISFADHAGDFGPATANIIEVGTPTNVQFAFASVANDAAWQSAKFDLGATRAALYNVFAALEFAATPGAGESVEAHIGWSPIAAAANGNPGGLSGSSAAYTGYSSNLEASLKQLDELPLFVTTAQATGTVQIAHMGLFVPKERYGILVLVNRSNIAMHSDDVEMNVIFDPIIDEAQ